MGHANCNCQWLVCIPHINTSMPETEGRHADMEKKQKGFCSPKALLNHDVVLAELPKRYLSFVLHQVFHKLQRALSYLWHGIKH